MLELFFSFLMLLLPFIALLCKKFIPWFLIAVVGSNPYVSAGSLLLALLVRFQDIFKSKINKSLLILSAIWLGYGLIIGIAHFSLTFLSEYIQLIIAILFLIYVYHTINTKKQILSILKFMMISGLILALFEIAIFLLNQDIDTKAFIGRTASNYASFYLAITTIVVPLFFIRKNFVWSLVILIGFFAIHINESRAMILLALALISKEFISFKSFYFKTLIIGMIVLVVFYLCITFDSALIYDPDSIFSVLNFKNNFSNLERLKLLFYSYDLFISNPFGYGLGSSYNLFFDNPVTVIKHYPHPHNTFAFLSVELGVVGVLIYIYFFYSMLKSIKKISDEQIKKVISNISLGLFLFSFVDVLFYNGVLMLIVFMLYGIVLASSKASTQC